MRRASCAAALLTVVVASASAQPQTGVSPQRFSLSQLLERAREHNAEVAVARGRLAGARSRLKEARSAYILPRLRLESLGGLVPDAEGDIFHPPSDTLGARPLGPFVRAELEFAQPLYTFGRLASLAAAAGSGVAVERAALDGARQDVEREVKKLYWGILLAQDLSDLARRLRGELETWQAEVSAEDPDVPLSAPYRLRLALLELGDREARLADELALAHAALAWKVGLDEHVEFELADGYLQPVAVQVPEFDELVRLALAQRADWRQLQAGVAARRAQERAARSAYYPQIFLAGGLRYAVAPGRTDQHNPFVKDEFNLFSGAVVLGVRQSFELGMLGAAVDRARAQRRQLEAREGAAVQGIRLEIRSARDEFERGRARLQSATQARNLTREWMQLARDEYELDPAQIKELVNAFEGLAAAEEAYYKAVFDYNVSLAELERAVGSSLSPGVDR